MRLFLYPPSVYCQKVEVAVRERLKTFEISYVDPFLESDARMLEALTPWGRTPVLVDGASVISESTIAAEYIDLAGTEGLPLLPENRAEALKARYWDRIVDLYVNVPVGRIFHQEHGLDGPRRQAVVDAARSQLRETYAVLAQHLRSATWLVGDTFSLADCAAVSLCSAADYESWSEHGPLVEYTRRLRDRPSVAETLRRAGMCL